MIRQDAALQVLVDACPSFAGAWHAHHAEHGNELLYIAAGHFADHLLRLHAAGTTGEFAAVGAAIERLQVEGDDWVREFSTIGILEDIQNAWLHAGTDPQAFLPWLGPQSRRWWQGLDAFWQGQAPLVRAAD